MATNLGRIMTSVNVLLPIMPHDSLITRPCEIRDSHEEVQHPNA